MNILPRDAGEELAERVFLLRHRTQDNLASAEFHRDTRAFLQVRLVYNVPRESNRETIAPFLYTRFHSNLLCIYIEDTAGGRCSQAKRIGRIGEHGRRWAPCTITEEASPLIVTCWRERTSHYGCVAAELPNSPQHISCRLALPVELVAKELRRIERVEVGFDDALKPAQLRLESPVLAV